MSIEDMDTIIRELRAIRARKLKAEELKNRMLDLIADAKEHGFTFIDKDFGQVWTGNDVELYDERS
jgi:spore germination protein YaaH